MISGWMRSTQLNSIARILQKRSPPLWQPSAVLVSDSDPFSKSTNHELNTTPLSQISRTASTFAFQMGAEIVDSMSR